MHGHQDMEHVQRFATVESLHRLSIEQRNARQKRNSRGVAAAEAHRMIDRVPATVEPLDMDTVSPISTD